MHTMKLISITNNMLAILLLCSCFSVLMICSAMDTITPTHIIRDPDSITSNGSVFKLGFFSPNGSTYRYVGIWFNDVPVLNVIWVANRDNPLNDSSGVARISENGNLLVLNGQNQTVWSSNFSTSSNFSSTSSKKPSAQILDSGNLVLRDDSVDNSGAILWESFKNPSDSFVQKMRLYSNIKTGEKTLIRSWTSPSDPSTGNFSAGLDSLTIPEVFIWNRNGKPYWRSGPWNGQVFIGVQSMNSVYLDGFSLPSEGDDTRYLVVSYVDQADLLSFTLDTQGTLKQITWNNETNSWEVTWLSIDSECDVYGKCGAYGSCNAKNTPICSCLRGFEPKNSDEWKRQNWTSGCVRTTELQCNRTSSGGENQDKEDDFFKLEMMKVPDFAQWSSALGEKCKNQCFENCSCVAYAINSGINCLFWTGDLIDIQQFSARGTDLYIRVAHSDLDKKQDMKVIIIIAAIIGAFVIAICAYFTWRWIAKKRDKRIKSKDVLLLNRGDAYPYSPDNMLGENITQEKLKELPVFSFATLATATNNFDVANKLGQGGFGPVYGGKLVDGIDIAVKRLSRASGQGLEEFMNEVVVISKLQHRNLVRILGCCIEHEEKMLVYEYMPNKSLDVFLFDDINRELLHWSKRFEIIEGIGRGLLYLHRDSRLRIIHRDLKASNILLDENLNPKISDFGMARIFVTNQDQANTNRVVGTYGYMSPEYAMEGRFSEKSDVFSFGVLLLEIVIGKRNTSFYNDENSTSLLGAVWKLWNEDSARELIDPVISAPSFLPEILRCIHVGLLCVQEYAKDRPTMSSVLSMLTSEILDLPIPKQPAFTEGSIDGLSARSAPNQHDRISINNVTVTKIQGR